ncbi:hypothetical protein XNA1_3600003 [Xenorhabdus nematophila str. Anatoliense]|nr:hypothetical protein XNA1_3600003 [Xenorhabdus nematophila str. Anatoliense]
MLDWVSHVLSSFSKIMIVVSVHHMMHILYEFKACKLIIKSWKITWIFSAILKWISQIILAYHL